MAADPAGYSHYTAKQLTDKEPALHDKMQGGLASEVLDNWGNHSLQTVHREASGQAEYHEKQADVIMIRKGEGTMVVGGKVVNGKNTTPDEIRGEKIEGGESHPVKAGDILHIPVKTPHQMLLKPGQKIDYIAVKVDAK
jgi:mannose-6-phosphate isomerase-like protein (cupin superfamily)